MSSAVACAGPRGWTAMEIRETTLSFAVARGSGPMSANRTIVFPRQVVRAVAAIRGYQIGFSGDDHHVGLLEVALDTAVDQNTVTVDGRLGCRDWSGNWDDDYGGTVQVSVLAELVSAAEPPPRGDVVVTAVEVSQAIQYFHSAEHLDAANVRPDNSIPLVAGKTTGIRAYVDYDASSGLPPITSLSGELVVMSGGATVTLSPVSAILPRRVTEIDRGVVDHTVNFQIPGAWCDGVVDITLRVFDASAPGQKSAAMHRTLRFVRVNPLRVYAVGVNYTGMGLNLAPPVESDFASTFDYTRRVWPTGDVLFSGYTTLEFSDSLAGTASEGCGSGFNSLLDDLRDIKGDTDDLVYGLLPNGTPLTGVGGCGGGGAGTGMVGGGQTAAHEAGHAVGRDHAPCDDSSRCDSPRNTDDDFPRYGSYVSDSIGEFGFDVESNTVFDPASANDFMGYSPNNWISPYTYAALMAKGDPSPSTGSTPRWVAAASGAAGAEFSSFEPTGRRAAEPGGRRFDERRPEWVKRREPVLFLRVLAAGDAVDVYPSFTYEAYRRPRGVPSDYEVHVLNGDGDVIACTPLERGCAPCDPGCGQAELIGEIPIEGDPAKLVVRRDGVDLAAFEFEPPVRLSCDWALGDEGELHLRWEAAGSGAPIWYLVQWQDRDGTWRGVAPRTTDTELIVPRRVRWATKDIVRLRILAVELLTTSLCELKFDGSHEEPPVDVAVYETPGAVAVLASDPLGRQVPAADLAWFDERGGEIGRGDRLPRRMVERGVVRVVPLGRGVTRDEGLAIVGDAVVAAGNRPSAEEHEHPHRHPREDRHEKGWQRAD